MASHKKHTMCSLDQHGLIVSLLAIYGRPILSLNWNRNNPWDNRGHLLVIMRQITFKASNVLLICWFVYMDTNKYIVIF